METNGGMKKLAIVLALLVALMGTTAFVPIGSGYANPIGYSRTGQTWEYAAQSLEHVTAAGGWQDLYGGYVVP